MFISPCLKGYWWWTISRLPNTLLKCFINTFPMFFLHSQNLLSLQLWSTSSLSSLRRLSDVFFCSPLNSYSVNLGRSKEINFFYDFFFMWPEFLCIQLCINILLSLSEMLYLDLPLPLSWFNHKQCPTLVLRPMITPVSSFLNNVLSSHSRNNIGTSTAIKYKWRG